MTQGEVPLYQQIKDQISARIESGEWPTDHRIPSENELVRDLAVSRMTVNRALRELASDGRVRRVQGLGTFVADRRPQLELLALRNIAEEIRSRGHRYRAHVHLLAREAASRAIAAALEVEPGAPVFHSVLVHCENGMPVQLEDRHVNPAAAPAYLEVDFSRSTPNEYLMRTAPLAAVEHVVEAARPDRRAQKLLGIPATLPCLILHRRTWSRGRVASCARLIHPGDRYRLGARFSHRDRVGASRNGNQGGIR